MSESSPVSANLSNPATSILHGCLEFVQRCFGRQCLLCGASADEDLCRACRRDLPFLEKERCRICALPLAAEGICGKCLVHPPHFARTLALFGYSFPVDALIRSLKYRGDLYLAPVLGRLLAEAARDFARPDFLLPVPLHPEKLRARGFNQAREIAKTVSGRLEIPMIQARKIVNTLPQTSLARPAREKNARGAYACDLDLSGRKIAVIDDVMTTGATQDEMAKVLLGCGAAEVSAWVIARALWDQ